jgi:hypothetical protein
MTRNESSFLVGSMIRAIPTPGALRHRQWPSRTQQPVRPGQGNPQASHPRRRDRKRPTRCLGIKTEIQLKLPRSHTQRRRRLQHREFSIVVC